MFRQIDQMGLLGCIAGLAITGGSVFAQPEANHTATTTDGAPDFDQPIVATSYGTSLEASAEVVETIDAVNDGRYRYFGYMSTVALGTESAIGGNGLTRTDIEGLDTSKSYLILVLHILEAETSATATINAGGIAEFIDQDGDIPFIPPWTPFQIVTGIDDFSFSAAVFAGLNGYAEATAIISLIEIVSNAQLHNDCDVNNDGLVDDQDIDLLNLALQTGAASSLTDANFIGMFDVDGDDDVDVADRDHLVYTCLGTDYGDTDLDGVVDNFDIITIISNYTEDIGPAGGKGWADGDTDGDGDVDDFDLQTAIANFTE